MELIEKPLVSIVALHYNNYNYVLHMLNSVSIQDYPNLELIIVDDCSTDDSMLLIEKWLLTCKIPVRIIKHEKNLGVCAVCNSGLRNSAGKYISMLATDDVMLPDRITKQVISLEESDDKVCATFSNMPIINADGELTGETFFDLLQVDDFAFKRLSEMSTSERIASMIAQNIFPAPSMLYKREFVLNIGGWDEALYFEDLDMNLRLTYAGFRFLWSNEKLVQYRVTQSSLTRLPNPRFLETYLAIIFKYKGMSFNIDANINKEIIKNARKIYALNGKKSLFWLKQSYLINKSKVNLFLLCSKALGMKYNSIIRLLPAYAR